MNTRLYEVAPTLVCQAMSNGWCCTLPDGHAGAHSAGGTDLGNGTCNVYAEWLDATEIEAMTAAAVAAERERLLVRIETLPTHNDTPVTPENLRWAATHSALSASWIFDVLTELADLLAEADA